MYLIQTVQTTWRPQLPLPKELQLTDERHDDEHNTKSQPQQPQQQFDHNDNNNSSNKSYRLPLEEEDMERLRSHHPHHHSLSGSAQQLTGKHKWSFGRLFRKKKDEEVGAECSASSSEEDRKAGFVPSQRQSASKPKAKGKSSRGSNKSLGFDHIVPQGTAPQPPPAPAKPQHVDNEFFLPVEMVPPEPYYQNQPGYYTRSSNSLDRRLYLTPQQQQQQMMMLQAPAPPHKSRSAQRGSRVNAGQPHSSEEELISLNSSTFSKYRSDESIHSGGQALQGGAPGQSRRSRAARNERYYKRLSRDGEVSHGGVPVQLQQQLQQQPLPHRYKTQPVPLSIYQAPPAAATPSSTTAYVQWQPQSAPRTLQNSMQSEGGSKRSISYDSHIHLQNVSGRQQSKPLPPPPPPRDPLRRVQQAAGGSQGHIGSSSGDLRPVSYAFDQSGRCVSDDRIWQPPHYQSVHSLNSQPGGSGSIASAPTQAQAHRRFITRSERNALPGKKSLPNGIDFHYVADATPRSRKPIHMLEGAATPPSSGMLRTSKSGLANSNDSWQQQQQQQAQQTPPARPQPLAKPRSISSSRLSELRTYPMPMYSEVQKPKRAPPELPANPAENVICGSLHIKPAEHESQNYVEIRHRDVHKTNSMPHHYQRRSGEDLPNKYEEYVAEKREQHQQAPAPRFTERKASAPAIAPLYFPRKKPANLEEAINELEAIYKSLGLTEPAEAKEEIKLEPKWETKLEPKLNQKLETKQEPRQEFRQESRQESRHAPRQESRQEFRQESRQEPRQESRQAPRQESRQEFRQESKPEPKPRMPTPSDFEKFALAHADDYDDEDSPAGEPDPVRDDVAYRNLQLSNLQHRATEKQPPFGIPVGPIVPAPQSDYLHVEPQTVRAPIARQQQQKKKSGSPDIVKDDLAVRALRKDPPGPKSSFIYPMQKKQRATRTQSANIYNLIQRDAAKPSGGDLSSYMELTRSIERAGSMSNLGGTEGSDATTSDIPATLDLLRKLKAQDEELQLKKPATHHIPFRHPSQGGAIAQLPQHLAQDELSAPAKAAPVPAPRKSLTPEPLLEDALNKIAQDAQASSIKLSQELHELRKEALITAARPKLNAEQQKLEQELQQIEAVSEAAKRCGQMLLETLPDQDEAPQQGQAEGHAPNPRKLHKEGKLIRAIDEVSEAANAVCEKILKDIVTTEPPVVVHEALQVKQQQQQQPQHQEPALVMPHLIKKLDPIQSDKIEAIAVRCMRQLSELASEATPTSTEDHDYDNLTGCNNNNMMSNGADTKAAAAGTDATLICPIAEGTSRGKGSKTRAQSKSQALDEIDAIMQECERQAKQQQTILISSSSTDDQRTTAPSMSSGSVSGGGRGGAATTTASSFSSSSDCLAKSSSPSNASRPMSSSITSFNPYSSSDYIKSQSSDYHAPSTDPIKTFSTTSYDVQSTPNNTTASNLTLSTPTSTSNNTSNNTSNTSNSTSTHHNQHASESLILSSVPKSPSTSPPLQLTPVGERRRRSSSSPSQYNSSEELAAIFGIEEQPKQRRKQPQLSTASTGNQGSPSSNANPCSTNTRYCAPVIVVVATSTTTTNEPEQSAPDCDATATATPTNDSARSSSNCSSHNSSKLATIPETEMEQELEQEQEDHQQMETELKLSPNFNRIYASKVNIVVDRTVETAVEQTQFDSLSSLGEETSSNPDSGNASLADFPLIGGGNGVVGNQANASLELHSAYNSRFEVREHYVSEVSISASEEDEVDGVSRVEHDFPPLPTEEELLESLREDRELNESGESVEETLKTELQVEEAVTESAEGTEADTKLNEELDEALKLDETPNESTELLLAEIKPNRELNEELDETSELDEALKLNETATLSDAVYDLASECLKIEERKELELDEDELDEAELDEDELAYNQLVELALDEALLEQTLLEDESIINELNESELDECDGAEQEDNELRRRKSIVYETPQINLSISEVRLNYETKVEQGATTTTTTTTATTTLDEAKQNEDIDDDDDVDDMPIKDTLARNESRGSENEIDIKGFPAQRERDNRKDEDKQVKEVKKEEQEKPTTSTKALSVFGEVRCVQRRGELQQRRRHRRRKAA